MSRQRKSDAELVIEYFGNAPVEEARLVLRLGKSALQRRMDGPPKAPSAAPRQRPKPKVNATAPTSLNERMLV